MTSSTRINNHSNSSSTGATVAVSDGGEEIDKQRCLKRTRKLGMRKTTTHDSDSFRFGARRTPLQLINKTQREYLHYKALLLKLKTLDMSI